MEQTNGTIAYQYIRDKIVSGALAPGTFLPTQGLSNEIGISRTPVRDALRQLEKDGLVTIKDRLGAVVKTVTYQEFRDICEFRKFIETFAAGLAAERGKWEDHGLINDAYEGMARIAEDSLEHDPSAHQEFLMQDLRFHQAILDSCGNEFLRAEAQRIQILHRVMLMSSHMGGLSQSNVPPPARQRILNEHKDIMDAIISRDRSQAEMAMTVHMDGMMRSYIRQWRDRDVNMQSLTAMSVALST